MHSKHNPIITDVMIRYRVVTQMTSTAYFDFCVLGKLTKDKQPILSNSYRNLKVTAFHQLRHLVTPLKYLLPFQQLKATFQIFIFFLNILDHFTLHHRDFSDVQMPEQLMFRLEVCNAVTFVTKSCHFLNV